MLFDLGLLCRLKQGWMAERAVIQIAAQGTSLQTWQRPAFLYSNMHLENESKIGQIEHS